MIKCINVFDLSHFRGKGRIQNIIKVVCFLVQMRARKWAENVLLKFTDLYFGSGREISAQNHHD